MYFLSHFLPHYLISTPTFPIFVSFHSRATKWWLAPMDDRRKGMSPSLWCLYHYHHSYSHRHQTDLVCLRKQHRKHQSVSCKNVYWLTRWIADHFKWIIPWTTGLVVVTTTFNRRLHEKWSEFKVVRPLLPIANPVQIGTRGPCCLPCLLCLL